MEQRLTTEQLVEKLGDADLPDPDNTEDPPDTSGLPPYEVWG